MYPQMYSLFSVHGMNDVIENRKGQRDSSILNSVVGVSPTYCPLSIHFFHTIEGCDPVT